MYLWVNKQQGLGGVWCRCVVMLHVIRVLKGFRALTPLKAREAWPLLSFVAQDQSGIGVLLQIKGRRDDDGDAGAHRQPVESVLEWSLMWAALQMLIESSEDYRCCAAWCLLFTQRQSERQTAEWAVTQCLRNVSAIYAWLSFYRNDTQ